MKDHQAAIRAHAVDLLQGGGAHLDFGRAVAGLPAALRGKKPHGLPHTCWRLVEHMRLAQQDILEFSQRSDYQSPDWPEGYWPTGDAPPNPRAWAQSIKNFEADRQAMCDLVSDPRHDLLTPLPWGDGQTLLREALLLADHNAYHLGQLVTVRRLIGAWGD